VVRKNGRTIPRFARSALKPTQLLGVMAGVFSCAAALAEPGKLLTPAVDYSIGYTSNLLGTPDDVVTQSGISRDQLSDTSHTVTISLAAEKELSRQALTAKVSRSHTTFNRFTRLDYDSTSLQGNWSWHLGDHLEGNVGVNSAETLTPFVEFHQNALNLRTERREYLDGAWLFHPSWRVHGSVAHSTLTYDLLEQRFGNRNFDSTEVGVDYLASGNNSVGLQLSRTDAVFPDTVLIGLPPKFNDYHENAANVKIDWSFSGKTHLRFLGGWTVRKHLIFLVRDYSGADARLIVNWVPTGKLGFGINLWREIGAVDNLVTSYSLNKGLSIAPTWVWSSKVRIEGKLNYETRDYNNIGGFGLNRLDTFRDVTLSVTYEATSHFQINASAFHDTLSSTIPLRAYRTNGVMITARYQF
jgi:exopolysaccharide biosynthesis operon protein EpsL